MSCVPICFDGFNFSFLFWLILVVGGFIALFAARLVLWLGKYKIVKR